MMAPARRAGSPSAPYSSLSGRSGRSDKPNVQINTALKAVLEALYGTEVRQRRLDKESRRSDAQEG